jgi:hypothetical protein
VSPSKRSRMVFVAAAAVAIALVAVLAGHWAAGSAAGVSQSGGASPGAIGSAYAGATSSDAADLLTIDPAKQEPALDKFHSKDPFVPLVSTSAGSPISSPAPSGSGTAQVPTGADIKINEKPYTVSKGDKVPPGSPAFVIADITSGGVKFDLLHGQTFSDGSTSVLVPEGQLVSVQSRGGKRYDLAVVQLTYATTGGGGGGGGGGGTTQGHSIKVLSIDSQNGTASSTFDVDGTTYADKQVGDTFTTDWGQIKVVAIDFAAQTVTILHGDATLTLHAGRVVVK